MPKPANNSESLLLRIELVDIEPLIWRRLRLRKSMRLDTLHNVIQIAFGWTDSHLHEYRAGGAVRLGVLAVEEEFGEGDLGIPFQDERKWTVGKLTLRREPEWLYVYDFGDNWRHRLIFEPPERRLSADLAPAPLCVAGENACPPDDVGGHPGYMNFLEALADPEHDEHEQYTVWIGGVFDPRAFDLNRINADLRQPRRRRR
jgi:hypothetical protein